MKTFLSAVLLLSFPYLAKVKAIQIKVIKMLGCFVVDTNESEGQVNVRVFHK